MPKISVADLQQGMVLADDLRSPQGRLLLPAGTELSQRHLTICKIWGVVEADIRDIEPEEVESRSLQQVDPEFLDRARALIRRRFSRADTTHPFVRELARQTVLQITQRGELPEEAPRAPELREAPPEAPPDIEELLQKQEELASLPDIFHHIVEAVNNPRSSAAFVADVISKDVGLSARLLRIVNSPLFGLGQKVDTLSRAVALVGSNQLTSLAMGVSVISMFRDVPPEFLDMQLFWQHSVRCGVWARLLAGQLRLPNEERAFLAGLLHDVGRLVMLKNAPATSCAVLAGVAPGTGLAFELEREHFGYDHAQLGRRLLESWNFPEELVRGVGGHHSPVDAADGPNAEASLVHVADITAHAFQEESGGPMDFVPLLDAEAWDVLGLNKNAIAPLKPQADHQLHEVMQTFF